MKKQEKPQIGASAGDIGKVQVEANRFRGGRWEAIEDAMTVELPLRVVWSDTDGAWTDKRDLWAWPFDLESLALGHVLLQVAEAGLDYDRAVVAPARDGVCSVLLSQGPFPSAEEGERREIRFAPGFVADPSLAPPTGLEPTLVLEGMRAFIASAGNWDGTGCFHRAGVFDLTTGRLLARAEDVGRHNCLDRLAGWSAVNGVPLADKALLTSARITASLCAKALLAGFRFLVSRSAVTTAAVGMALERGATLIGFGRADEERFTVFADAARRVTVKGD